MVVAECVCVECGADITGCAAPSGSHDQCGVCRWIDAMPDLLDRDGLRRQMLRIGLVGPAR